MGSLIWILDGSILNYSTLKKMIKRMEGGGRGSGTGMDRGLSSENDRKSSSPGSAIRDHMALRFT